MNAATPRVPKFLYLHVVQGDYGQGWEDLTAGTYTEAQANVRDYRQNEPGPFRLIRRREPNPQYVPEPELPARMPLKNHATEIVFVGGYLPAHDQVFDLAENIAEQVDVLRGYIASVRDPQQADAAAVELLTNLAAALSGDTVTR